MLFSLANRGYEAGFATTTTGGALEWDCGVKPTVLVAIIG